MKKIILLILSQLLCVTLFSQAPHSFKYQAVVRDNQGKILDNRLVGLKISILKDSPIGTVIYVETHQKVTNQFGIVTVEIGDGTVVSGNFNTIQWSNGTYFVRTDLDVAQTGIYDFIGTSQLLAVPYAIYANEAGKATNDNDTSSTNELQNLNLSGNNLSISNGNSVTLPTDNDNQALTLNGTTLSISNGNSVNLTPDNDHDTLNEIQIISKTGNTVSLSKNGGSITDSDNQSLSINDHQLNISNGNNISIPDNQTLTLNGTTLSISNGNSVSLQPDNDHDTLNEIQTISKNGNTISLSKNGGSITDSDNQTISLNGNQLNISGGNSITLSGTVDLDSDPTNEIQNLSLSNDTLKISLSNQVVFPHDADRDSTNELQVLSRHGDTLSLSKGNFIVFLHDGDRDSTNELQTLSYVNDTLRLSKGNFAVISYSQLTPTGTCINSNIANPPSGFSFSGEVFEPSEQPWIQRTFDYSARTQFGIGTLNNKIYVVGGDNYPNAILNSTVMYFNITTNTDANASNISIARRNPKVETVNNKIIAFGGTISGYSYAVEEYNETNNTWTTKNNMPQINDFSYCSLNDKIYTFGGFTQPGDNAINLVYEYNSINDTWTAKSPTPTILNYTCNAVYNNKIYLIGGKDGLSAKQNKVYEFDPNTNTWVVKSNMPTKRYQAQAVVLNDKIYVFGGIDSLSQNCTKVEVFDPITDAWSSLVDMPISTNIFVCCAAKNKIYFVSNTSTYEFNPYLGTWKTKSSLPSFANTMKTYVTKINDKIFILKSNDTGSQIDLQEYNPQSTFYIHCKN